MNLTNPEIATALAEQAEHAEDIKAELINIIDCMECGMSMSHNEIVCMVSKVPDYELQDLQPDDDEGIYAFAENLIAQHGLVDLSL
jgi:hypothetical protein